MGYNKKIGKILWMKGIEVCSNEGPRCFSGRDNYKVLRKKEEILKISPVCSRVSDVSHGPLV